MNAAQAPIDAADNLEPSPQRNLEMGGGFHWPALEQVVRPHPDGVALSKRRRQDLGVIVDLREEHGLVQELHAMSAQVPNIALRFHGDLADVVEMRYDHRRLSGITNPPEHSRQSGIFEALGSEGDRFRTETDRIQVRDRQQMIEDL